MRDNPHRTIQQLRNLAARTSSQHERETALRRALEIERKYNTLQKSSFEAIAQAALRWGYVEDGQVLRGIHFLYNKGWPSYRLEISEFACEWRILRNADTIQTVASGCNAQALDSRLTELLGSNGR
jgi:hypothetical protein